MTNCKSTVFSENFRVVGNAVQNWNWFMVFWIFRKLYILYKSDTEITINALRAGLLYLLCVCVCSKQLNVDIISFCAPGLVSCFLSLYFTDHFLGLASGNSSLITRSLTWSQSQSNLIRGVFCNKIIDFQFEILVSYPFLFLHTINTAFGSWSGALVAWSQREWPDTWHSVSCHSALAIKLRPLSEIPPSPEVGCKRSNVLQIDFRLEKVIGQHKNNSDKWFHVISTSQRNSCLQNRPNYVFGLFTLKFISHWHWYLYPELLISAFK